MSDFLTYIQSRIVSVNDTPRSLLTPWKQSSNDVGFTIVELLAAMVISSLVVAFVYSMYLFTERLTERWQRTSELSSVVGECAHRIAFDVLTCSDVDECNDSLLVLERDHLDTIYYRFTVGVVTRNGVSFSADDVRLDAVVSSEEDTSTMFQQPVLRWSIRVIGRSGDSRDSSFVRLLAPMSSEEVMGKYFLRPPLD